MYSAHSKLSTSLKPEGGRSRGSQGLRNHSQTHQIEHFRSYLLPQWQGDETGTGSDSPGNSEVCNRLAAEICGGETRCLVRKHETHATEFWIPEVITQ